MDILNQFTDDQIALAACGLAVLVGFGLIALFRENTADVPGRSAGTPSSGAASQPAASSRPTADSVPSQADPSTQRAA